MASIFAITMTVAALTMAEVPIERWCVDTGMANPAPPLVADLHGADGLETLVLFPGDGAAQCFGARGELLWIHSADAPLALAAPAFLSGLLVFASSAGEVVALNPATGEERWRSESVGEAVLGIALADIDDDDRVEIIVTTRAQGVTALDDEGRERWRFDMPLSGAPAIMDVNDDGYAEIYVIGERGPVGLDYDGLPLWEADEDGGFAGTPIVGDADGDMLYEVYAIAGESPALIAFDADLGGRVWERSLEAVGSQSKTSNEASAESVLLPAYASGQLAFGDVNGDGVAEIAVSLPSRSTQLVAREAGGTTWENSCAAIAFANTNRDSRSEITAASGKRVFGTNLLEGSDWQFENPQPAVATPIICDMDGGGPAAILLVFADGRLCRHQASGPYVRSLSPWPMDGANSARTHSVISTALYEAADGELALVPESVDIWALADAGGGFEIVTEAADGRVKLAPPISIDPDLQELEVTVEPDAAFDGVISVHWMAGETTLRADELKAVKSGDRELYRLGRARPALSASTIRVVAETDESGTLPAWKQVALRGRYGRIPSLRVFYNHVGYELGGVKHFTAEASFRANEGTLALLSDQDKVVFERPLTGIGEEITGAYGSDWGGYYWRGDFSEFDEPGRYRLRVRIDNATAESAPFEIEAHLLWQRLFGAALHPYQTLRCGEPGAECPPEAGWYDPATGAAADPAPHVLALARSLSFISWRLEAAGDTSLDTMQAALRWGADALLAKSPALIATGGAEENALAAAALAAAARELAESDAYSDAAGELLRHEGDRGSEALLLWSAAIDLFVATEDEAYKEMAIARFSGPQPGALESSVAYETHIDEYAMTSFYAAHQVQSEVQPIVALADNPFGVVTFGTPKERNWFDTPDAGSGAEPAGQTLAILDAAKWVAQAYRFQPTPANQAVILGQLNWLLGNNPLGITMIAGFGGEAAADAADFGVVARGIAGRAPGDDRPALDGAPPSLLNNARLIEVLANYKRVRLSM